MSDGETAHGSSASIMGIRLASSAAKTQFIKLFLQNALCILSYLY
jgi:hypothetical protein